MISGASQADIGVLVGFLDYSPFIIHKILNILLYS